MELLVKLLIVFIIACSLLYTIINFKKVFEVFQRTEKKQGFLYALYFSIYLTLIFNPLDSDFTGVAVFNRVIGKSLIDGVDVSKRIRNFNGWFICLAVLFSLFFLLANYIKSKDYSEENRRVIKFLDNVIILANVIQGFRCITFFYEEAQETSIFYFSDYLIIAILLMGMAYISLSLEKKLSVDMYAQLLISGAMLSYPLTIFVTNCGIPGYQEWDSGRLLMGIQIAVSVLFTLIIKIAKIDWRDKNISVGLVSVTMCLSFVPFFTSFFIELIVILNQYKIFVAKPGVHYFRAIICGFFFVALLLLIVCRNNIQIKNWKIISYPLIVFGIACLWRQIDISAVYKADLMESANYSVLISDFLNFGDIPLIGHYGGHMMTGVWEGIIYALLNNDSYGAIFSPYSGYIATVIAVLFFLLMRHIYEDDLALLITLCFPFSEVIDYWGLGILTCLAALAFVKRNSYMRAFLFWLSLVWCILYRLDLGFAFAIACVVTLILYVFWEKNAKAVKQLILTMLVVGTGGVTAWCILCLISGVNPIIRLLEFLTVSASNQNWAFTGIGNNSLYRFAWAYLFVPFMVVICMANSILSKRFRENTGKERLVLLLILGFSFWANYSRGLVRHSLEENNLSLVMWSAYAFLSLFVVCVKNNSKLFIPVFAVFILCNPVLLGESVISERSIADYSAERIGVFIETWKPGQVSGDNSGEEKGGKSYWEQIADEQKVIKRVVLDDDQEIIINDYQVVMDALLEENETFVDFTNKTFIYSAINRQNPVYVSQSPLQLSGEFSQEAFIKEIEGIPIILMPIESEDAVTNSQALDSIANTVRYYKVAEYIYQNYVPLCKYKEAYAIWCLSERYDEMVRKIKKFSEEEAERKDIIDADGLSCTRIDYGYDGPFLEDDGNTYEYLPYLHSYSVGDLPVIWAERDKKNSAENAVVTDLVYADGIFQFSFSEMNSDTNGNYLKVSIRYAGREEEDTETTSAELKIGDYVNGKFEIKYKYIFNVMEGQHEYIFRISSDYYWYLKQVNTVKLECNGDLLDIEMEILEGD